MKWLRHAAWLLVGLMLLAACSKPAPSRPIITWTGAGLGGADFAVRETTAATVHYTQPTSPTQAETAANQASLYARNEVKWGRMLESDRVHLWILPAGAPWPKEVAAPPPFSQFRAVAPGVVLGREEGLKSPAQDGMVQAFAVAATQKAGSPVFASDWLHEGMGAILSGDMQQFPAPQYRSALSDGKSAREMIQALQKDPAAADRTAWQAAARGLASLLMDRWGVEWTTNYPRASADLTPQGALLWGTGAAAEGEALALWQERLDDVAKLDPQATVPSLADTSPVRVEPRLTTLPKGPGPMDNYSPHSYAIDARYDPAKRLVEGTTALTWQNGESIGVDTLYFNLWANAEQYARFGGAITVQSVTVGGQPVKFAAKNLDLVVPLGRTVSPGEKAEVVIGFTTRLPGIVTGRVLGQDGEKLFNLAHWYPILAVLDDRGWVLHAMPNFPGEPYSEIASYQVRLDVPAGTLVAATGHPLEKEEQSGRWVYRWDAPNVRDWVAVGGKGLVEEQLVVEGVTIRAVDPNREAAKQIAEDTGRALKLFTDRFGPYAYPDLVAVPCCAGLEYPGLFYTSQPSLQNNWWHTVTFHELGHQWFFGMVGNDQYNEAWLDEGFARYAERLGNRTFGYTDQLRDIRSRTIPRQVRVNSSTVSFNIHGGYTPAVYDRGALVLEDLEEMLGADMFRQVMRTYVERYKFKTATTADFVRTAEEVAGRDLKQFFLDHAVDPSMRESYRAVIPPGQVKPR